MQGQGILCCIGPALTVRCKRKYQLWRPPTTWLNNPSTSNPISLPQNNIEYVVRVSNAAGCFDTDTILVKVFKVKPDLYVPNAFTPNGDGNNDIFQAHCYWHEINRQLPGNNRWGQMLYSGTGNGAGWDGTFGGKGLGKQPPMYGMPKVLIT